MYFRTKAIYLRYMLSGFLCWLMFLSCYWKIPHIDAGYVDCMCVIASVFEYDII